MSIYRPTWLYIKQHNQTGLRYFGKTCQTDPYRYSGSGKRWKNHIDAHGNDISTVWCKLFEDKEELIEFALALSIIFDIVSSDKWANLKFENGVDGGSYGTVSQETKDKMSASMQGRTVWNTGKTMSTEYCDKLSLSKKGKSTWSKGKCMSEETKSKMSLAKKGKPKSPETIAKKRATLARKKQSLVAI